MKTKYIGLTGQTGAGKSTVSEFAKEMSCHIINADSVAREVMQKDSECLKRLAKFFGSDIIKEDGNCNRKLLAQRAFSSRENTDMLNRITHPIILAKTKEYLAMYPKENEIIFFDAPQLFESGGDSLCDTIIAVIAPVEVRLKRIISRDNITEQEALLRIHAQYDENYFRTRANYIIDGSKTLEEVKQQLMTIIHRIRQGD